MSPVRDWHAYWRSRPVVADDDRNALLQQVGKTVLGRPIGEEDIATIVAGVVAHLGLGPDDRLLEIGCGNGLLTAELAAHCDRVVAFDYSPSLVSTARLVHQRDNIEYFTANAEEASGYAGIVDPIDKALSYEVLQHLSVDATRRMLGHLTRFVAPSRVLLGSIPDRARIRAFYDTESRWQHHLEMERRGLEPIGHWWEQETLAGLAEEAGFEVDVIAQDPGLYTAHYRFDALLTRA